MIALIPARCGSKGLPGKNIKKLLGKPLIAYTIEAALQSQYVSRVVVSTDCQEIASEAIKYGATVTIRPSELATDSALAIDVYNFHLKDWELSDLSVESFIVLQPTSPLRTVKNIETQATKQTHA